VLWWLPGQIVVVLSSGDRPVVFVYVRGMSCVCDEKEKKETGNKEKEKRTKIGKWGVKK